MIARHWRGIAKPGEAGRYIGHLKTDTFPKLAAIHGFISASILTRELEHGTEFLVITRWDSMDAIEQFAGPSAEEAVVPASVQSMMVEFDQRVIHYEVVEDYRPKSN
ncbi:MAG: antibiotic biosynthesis monooxygenase [Thermodesulfobacteriota bacterium]